MNRSAVSSPSGTTRYPAPDRASASSRTDGPGVGLVLEQDGTPIPRLVRVVAAPSCFHHTAVAEPSRCNSVSLDPERSDADPTLGMPPYWCPEHRSEFVECSGGYRCPSGHGIPLVRGVPRFVATEDYAASFGRQWNRFRTTQLDSRTGLPLSKERALRCMGLVPDEAKERPLLADQNVLEVGCGAGRFTEVLLEHGALVTSVDISTAVDANAANFPPGPRHRIAQADVRALPFAPREFDGVFCLGVVQHTPDPEATIAALYEQVRPGGWLAFDHYARSVSTATWLGMRAARRWFLPLPVEDRLPTVERLVDRLLPLHRVVGRRSRTAARALSRISPVLSYYHLHPALDDPLQREWAILDTHDAVTDAHKHHRSLRQIRAHMSALGLTEVVVERAGNGVEARGRRPPEA